MKIRFIRKILNTYFNIIAGALDRIFNNASFAL